MENLKNVLQMVKMKLELEDERETKQILFFKEKNAFEIIIWLFTSLALPLSENQNPQCYLCPLLVRVLHWSTTFEETSKGRMQNPQWY